MYPIKIQTIDLQGSEKLEVEEFLADFDLSLDKDVEYTLIARTNRDIIGTCSYAGKVIKCFAVKKDMQGEGIAAKLISHLTNILFDRGIFHTFIFTKPSNKYLFMGFGYHEVYSTNEVTLLESSLNNIEKYIEGMYNKTSLGKGKKSALVMNCNPFTLGHRYLVEKASFENETVIVFVLEEDRSSFPFNIRYNLVKQGVKHLENVHVLAGGDYIISSNTFPSYFIKEDERKDKAFKELDAGIFGKYISPVFNINRRYVGTEPFCNVTNGYNQALYEILPEFGVEVKVVERFLINGMAVSASTVRRCIKDDNWIQIKKLVPETTFAFLESPQAKEIINKIKGSEFRH